MFDTNYIINLYKSKINTYNYIKILEKSLKQVVSLDIINVSIIYIIEDQDYNNLEMFLDISLLQLKTNILYFDVFIKSNYLDLLEMKLSYNTYVKFKEILNIIRENLDLEKTLLEKPIEVKNLSICSYILYKEVSDNMEFDRVFSINDFSKPELNIYKNLLVKMLEYNKSNEKFLEYCEIYNIAKCINVYAKNYKEKENLHKCNVEGTSINKSVENSSTNNQTRNINSVEVSYSSECMYNNSIDDLKSLVSDLMTNRSFDKYNLFRNFDYNNSENENLIVELIRNLLSKDIYNLKKIKLIIHNINLTRRILFSYFVYLFITYNKYNNKYIKDRILNLIYLTDFGSVYEMILEYYISLKSGDIHKYDTYDKIENELFQELTGIIYINIRSFMHVIYPLLNFKYGINIEELTHYIKIKNILENKQEENITYKEIALLLLRGYYKFGNYKLHIRNNITKILSIIREEYNNRNIDTCIFNILQYLNTFVTINNNIINYFRIKGCQFCDDKCFEDLSFYTFEEILGKTEISKIKSRQIYKYFISSLNNEISKIKLCDNYRNTQVYDNDLLRNIYVNLKKLDIEQESRFISCFVYLYLTNIQYRNMININYYRLPLEIQNIIGHMKIKNRQEIKNIKIFSDINELVDYIKTNLIDDIKMDNEMLYNEFMDLLYYNTPGNFSEIQEKEISDLKKLRNYNSFLIYLNDILCKDTHEFVKILKYTPLFSTKILEISIMNLLYYNKNIEQFKDIFSDILRDKYNIRIMKYILNCNLLCNMKLESGLLINSCLEVNCWTYAIYLIEDEILNGNEGLYDTLQSMYYNIEDYERVKGINNKFTRLSKSNLFFEFNVFENGLVLSDDILDEFKIIEDDFKEYRNIKVNNSIGRHFIQDCKLIDEDINNLDLVCLRREICNDTRMIMLHELLVKGLIKKYNIQVDNSQISKKMSDEIKEDVNTIECLSNNFTDKLSKFYIKLKRDLLKELINLGRLDKATNEIHNLLLMKEWSFYYELSEICLLQNKKHKAIEYLKRILDLYGADDPIYKKSLFKYCEIIDTKKEYEKNIDILKNTSRAWYLFGKCVESESSVLSIDYYLNCLRIDEEYKYECIPRIFHLLAEMTDKKKITETIKKLEDFFLNQKYTQSQRRKKAKVTVQEECSNVDCKILLPFYNQILCKINSKHLKGFINNLVLRIMDEYKEVYWSSLYFIEEINTECLKLDNKIYLGKIKKMRDVLYNLSKNTQLNINLKTDYKEIYEYMDIEIPICSVSKVKITDIEEEVYIYRSLQSPKRVCFIGDTGKKYYFLCKYKDDLRKDSRVIDLCKLVNKLFKMSNMADYYIRTYEVIPVYYNFGIIEFIEDLKSIKNIVYSKSKDYSVICNKYSRRKKLGVDGFKDAIEFCKPVFHEYIKESTNIKNTKDILKWYKRRDNYIRTYAIMNIIGWFMGLGDRHTENITFDIESMDTIHVDLNCIFDRAKSITVPELVPFRLTRNIVNGFGVLGIHGTYQNTCYKTLDLLVKNKSIILNNLLSFVYDPLHEWSKKENTAKKYMETLNSKIEGIDVCSRVNELNEEAMDENNLANMYIGWLSFM